MIWFLFFSLLFITIMLCIKDYIDKKNTKWLYIVCFILNIYEFLCVKGFTYSEPFLDFFDYPISFWIGYFWASIVSVIISIVISFKKSTKKEEKTAFDNVFQNKDSTISELMIRSKLSKEICIDIYNILTDFKLSRRETAFNKIQNNLIPDLKKDGNMGNVGIAFGMLIDDIALTKEEANYYSTKVIEEILNTKDTML